MYKEQLQKEREANSNFQKELQVSVWAEFMILSLVICSYLQLSSVIFALVICSYRVGVWTKFMILSVIKTLRTVDCHERVLHCSQRTVSKSFIDDLWSYLNIICFRIERMSLKNNWRTKLKIWRTKIKSCSMRNADTNYKIENWLPRWDFVIWHGISNCIVIEKPCHVLLLMFSISRQKQAVSLTNMMFCSGKIVWRGTTNRQGRS